MTPPTIDQSVIERALRDVLTKARDQFLFYEQSHLAKYPPWELEMVRKGIVNVSMGRDAYEKALVNAEMAAMCKEALSLSPSPIAGKEGEGEEDADLVTCGSMNARAVAEHGELPTCPHCAPPGYLVWPSNKDQGRVKCTGQGCGATGGYGSTITEAVAKWSARAITPPAECVATPGEVGKLCEALRQAERRATRLGIDVMDPEAMERWRAGPTPSSRHGGHDMAANWNSVRRLVALIDLLANERTQMEAREQAMREAVSAVLPSAAGAADQPDTKVIAFYINLGELRGLRALLNPTPTEER